MQGTAGGVPLLSAGTGHGPSRSGSQPLAAKLLSNPFGQDPKLPTAIQWLCQSEGPGRGLLRAGCNAPCSSRSKGTQVQ